jgi:hypothetical protein
MQYIRLGNSGLQVSRLCLGTMNMGTPDWKPWIFDEKQASRSSPMRWTTASTSSTWRTSIPPASAKKWSGASSSAWPAAKTW